MRVVLRLVAAVVLTAAASAGAPLAPAGAAACPSADGVSVVVDFHELGGGVRQVCDTGGAGTVAAEQFADAGFALTRVQRQQGFVCRVDGVPANDPCVNTPPGDAYWGLWWSDGKSGSWSYSTQGVDSLKVPAGGYVALSWNGSSTKSPPGAAPSPHPAQPTPAPGPTAQPPSSGGGGGGGGGGAGGGNQTSSPTSGAPGPAASPSGAEPTAGPTAGPSEDRTRHGEKDTVKGREKDGAKDRDASPGDTSPSASASAGATPGPEPAATADAADPSDDGLPAWVAPAGIALLFAAAAGTAVVRRRRGTTGP
jgi:hypothetical protein